MNLIFKKKKQKGYALLEMVFYICLLGFVAILVTNSLIIMMNSFKEIKINNELAQGTMMVEKISREIKQANSIFSLNTNSLSLNTKDSLGNNKKITFSLNGDNLQYLENDVLIGNLNKPTLVVSSLSFNLINTNKSSAIRFLIEFHSVNDSSNKIVSFQNTLILRGAY